MSRKKVLVLDKNYAVPVRAIRQLLDHIGVREIEDDYVRSKDPDHVGRAVFLVEEWISAEWAKYLDTLAENEHAPEVTEDHAAYGLCPHCYRTDGIINLWDVDWSYCHAHRTKWRIRPGVVPEGEFYLADWAAENWDVIENSYREVKPLLVGNG